MTKELNSKTEQALAALLDYVEYDEGKDYEREPRTGHIYESIQIVRDWLGPVHGEGWHRLKETFEQQLKDAAQRVLDRHVG
jgi:hypothetical protein